MVSALHLHCHPAATSTRSLHAEIMTLVPSLPEGKKSAGFAAFNLANGVPVTVPGQDAKVRGSVQISVQRRLPHSDPVRSWC